MNTAQRLLVPLLIPLASGCATEGAVFVTKTSLALVDVDGTPPEATIGVNRVEGFIAPRNRNGDTPPVLAHLQSDRALLQPNVQQVYATGTAAERLAGKEDGRSSDCSAVDCPGETEGKPLIFATSTNIGLRIGLGSQPTSPIDGIVLGYRRKEMSYVPVLAKDRHGNFRYPSLIAAIRLAGPSTQNAKGFSACQGFATGTAATALAEQDDAGFGCLDDNKSVRQMLTSKQGVELRQQAEITATLRCYAAAAPRRRQAAREQAEQFGLLAPAAEGGRMSAAAGGDFKTAAYTLADEDSRYAMRLLLGTVPPKKTKESSLPLSEQELDAATKRPKGEGAGPVPLGAGPQGSAASPEPRKPDGSVPLAIAASLREHLLRAHRAYVCAAPDASAN